MMASDQDDASLSGEDASLGSGNPQGRRGLSDFINSNPDLPAAKQLKGYLEIAALDKSKNAAKEMLTPKWRYLSPTQLTDIEQSKRRRQASRRLETLASGLRDPLDKAQIDSFKDGTRQ